MQQEVSTKESGQQDIAQINEDEYEVVPGEQKYILVDIGNQYKKHKQYKDCVDFLKDEQEHGIFKKFFVQDGQKAVLSGGIEMAIDRVKGIGTKAVLMHNDNNNDARALKNAGIALEIITESLSLQVNPQDEELLRLVELKSKGLLFFQKKYPKIDHQEKYGSLISTRSFKEGAQQQQNQKKVEGNTSVVDHNELVSFMDKLAPKKKTARKKPRVRSHKAESADGGRQSLQLNIIQKKIEKRNNELKKSSLKREEIN